MYRFVFHAAYFRCKYFLFLSIEKKCSAIFSFWIVFHARVNGYILRVQRFFEQFYSFVS